MLKKNLRSTYVERRKAISDHHLLKSSLAIANALLDLPIWHHEYYHIFMSIAENREVDSTPILSILHGKDKQIIIPKVSYKGNLQHYLLTDATKLRINRWNIPEPVDGIEIPTDKIDVVFIPLLAFDKKGNRVGYGKGFYDIFLRKCRNDVLKIGVSLFKAEDSIEDVHINDVPLDYCVTPEKIYYFSGGGGGP
ncbi:5-formyltetrahydrofolate cyclo-ligase [Pricia sp. S334]|uniref:5-formyltetrahydrofolate cyclo-ligase n=1 Tax=Pricia mediterranea TaxID=3076079 RepID=A0ABU3L5X8_9FLAO|nr:5-formyltetrahydrofolate cyclo-ligase [Pricia sp. S334]MDT7829072.1 5-formyltetrahydrofolate cyclo-ligase [Pricia sp. S334]